MTHLPSHFSQSRPIAARGQHDARSTLDNGSPPDQIFAWQGTSDMKEGPSTPPPQSSWAKMQKAGEKKLLRAIFTAFWRCAPLLTNAGLLSAHDKVWVVTSHPLGREWAPLSLPS